MPGPSKPRHLTLVSDARLVLSCALCGQKAGYTAMVVGKPASLVYSCSSHLGAVLPQNGDTWTIERR